jgi:predicted Fe-S protein YdhL (DUF1289 family)
VKKTDSDTFKIICKRIRTKIKDENINDENAKKEIMLRLKNKDEKKENKDKNKNENENIQDYMSQCRKPLI